MKKAIFGVGHFGKYYFHENKAEDIDCFIDNNSEKWGEKFEGKPILSLDDYLKYYSSGRIIVAVNNFGSITKQLRNRGIFDYEIYNPFINDRLNEIKEKMGGGSGKIVLLGIDERTEIILTFLKNIGAHKDQIILTDLSFHDNKWDNWDEYKCVALEEAVKQSECLIISSEIRAYALQEHINREYPSVMIINPFILNGYGDSKKLVVNPYEGIDHDITENEWEIQNGDKKNKIAIQTYMEELYKSHSFFEHIEIETFNRCNGVCDFCPVSAGNEKRPIKKMDEKLFQCIIDQLAERDYEGRLATFSNNEPFLDERIVSFNKYARAKLPKARMHLFTNGTVLRLDEFIQIIGYLDEMIIDNYNQELELIPSVKEIVDYCEKHYELKKKVTVVTRKPHEIRTSRGGDAPNRERTDYLADFGCVLPFKQMIVRPDGKVSLCCNDPYGKYTLGDLTKQSLEEVWYGENYEMIRKSMLEGRKNFGECRYCDAIIMY